MKINRVRLIAGILVLVNLILIIPLPDNKFPVSSGDFWASLLGMLIGWAVAVSILQQIIRRFINTKKEDREFIALNIAVLIYIIIFLVFNFI